jgi:4-amino-4-deoxy-L-arabinose transferase-like glycosyltransferase
MLPTPIPEGAAGRAAGNAPHRMDALLAALAAALYATVALFMVFNGSLNIDEGFYGLSSRAAMQGLLPYRDFGYTQLPLFPYINGAVMELTGFGFVGQRLASALWAALTMALGSAWLWRRRGRLAGLGYVAVMASGLQWMYFAHIGKTNALAGFLILAAAVIVVSRPRIGVQIFATSLLGVVAIGCRLPVAPFFIVVWIGLLVRNFSPGNLLRAALWPAVFGLLLIGPFIAAAPDSFRFWALDIHGESRFVRNWHLDLKSMFPLSPALCLMGLLLPLGLLSRRVRVSRPVDLVLLALFVALVCNVLPTGAYPEYPAPFVPSFIFALSILLADMGFTPRRQAFGLALFVIVNLTIRAPTDHAVYRETRRAADYVRQFQRAPYPFVGSASMVALEAGVPVPDWLVMAPFCCSESFSESAAAERHLATPDRIARLMADPGCNVFVMYTAPVRNFVWSMPRFVPISDASVARWKAILAERFTLEYGDSSYAVFIRRTQYGRPADPKNVGR